MAIKFDIFKYNNLIITQIKAKTPRWQSYFNIFAAHCVKNNGIQYLSQSCCYFERKSCFGFHICFTASFSAATPKNYSNFKVLTNNERKAQSNNVIGCL
jgi:hypothetical protein